MSVTDIAPGRDAHTRPIASGREAALSARAIRQRLMNPHNAITDPGITMRNGRPVRRPAEFVKPPPVLALPDPPVVAINLPSGEPVTIWPTNSAALIKRIIKLVAEAYDVTPIDILSDRREPRIIRPRHISMWLAKRLTPRSMPFIGRCFGGRDHTTVLHAVRKINHTIAMDEALKQQIAGFVAILAPEEAA